MLLASFSAQFTWIDWSVVAAYLAFTTWLGASMAGKQATIRDFFLGGRKLPWYAVSGSIIATEISAVTFIIVPMIVFRPGGNMTYLQLGLFGAIISRIIVGYWLVPAYYKREIYSPYDYMGNQLGPRVRTMTTILFSLGGVLAQSARVYLTAEIMVVILHGQLQSFSEAFGLNPLAWAILLIAAISVGWTFIGGISTVIWTDAVLFLVFLVGASAALIAVIGDLPGGVGEMIRVGWEAKASGAWGKFTFFDFSPSPTRAYTIWTAIIANTWVGIGAYGTDQLIAQRIFCCRNERDARIAIISSSASQIVTFMVAFVGVGLYAYYTLWADGIEPPAGVDRHAEFPRLVGEARALYEAQNDRIFPIFIVEGLPQGLSGLVVAGLLAAAISSMTSILAALSQTSMTAFYAPLRRLFVGRSAAASDERSSVLASRLWVLFWGAALAAMAFLSIEIKKSYPSILDLALAMSGYAGGALLAGFALSFFRLRIDDRGFLYSGPLSVLCVFAMIWHNEFSHAACWIAAVVFLVVWVWGWMSEAQDVVELRDPAERSRRALTLALRDGPQTLILLAGVGLMLWLAYYGYWSEGFDANGVEIQTKIAWPWQIPVGSTIAFIWGYLLSRRGNEEAQPCPQA